MKKTIQARGSTTTSKINSFEMIGHLQNIGATQDLGAGGGGCCRLPASKS